MWITQSRSVSGELAWRSLIGALGALQSHFGHYRTFTDVGFQLG